MINKDETNCPITNCTISDSCNEQRLEDTTGAVFVYGEEKEPWALSQRLNVKAGYAQKLCY